MQSESSSLFAVAFATAVGLGEDPKSVLQSWEGTYSSAIKMDFLKKELGPLATATRAIIVYNYQGTSKYI